MSMRVAWAFYPRNVSLGISAQVFVYAGTIILYICNWFFTQRIVRAQHPRLGWSKAFRIFHRGGIICLVISLLMVIVGSIQQYFSLDKTTIRIDHSLQLAGFTYFGTFTIAPIVLVVLSLVIPRRETEKFGAGRLRNAITILFIGSFILALGQCYRTAIGWFPEIPIRNSEGQANNVPWYFSKASFYVFNFLTELIVVIFYAVMRVDLRFHVADGSKKAGDYRAGRESMFNVNEVEKDNRLKQNSGKAGSIRSVKSTETVHEYEASLFDDTRTLADSLRYPSSVLEVDAKTGHYKIKRMSAGRLSTTSQATLWDPVTGTYVEQEAPPVPPVPADWPLRDSQLHIGQIPVKEHRGRSNASNSISSRPHQAWTPEVERGNPLDDTLKQLEGNAHPDRPPPGYDFVAPLMPKKAWRPASLDSTRSHKRVYLPMTDPSDLPSKIDYSQNRPSSYAPSNNSDLPRKKTYAPSTPQTTIYSPRSSRGDVSSVDLEAADHRFAGFSFEALPDTDAEFDDAAEEKKKKENGSQH